jgi:hypothetical protein
MTRGRASAILPASRLSCICPISRGFSSPPHAAYLSMLRRAPRATPILSVSLPSRSPPPPAHHTHRRPPPPRRPPRRGGAPPPRWPGVWGRRHWRRTRGCRRRGPTPSPRASARPPPCGPGPARRRPWPAPRGRGRGGGAGRGRGGWRRCAWGRSGTGSRRASSWQVETCTRRTLHAALVHAALYTPNFTRRPCTRRTLHAELYTPPLYTPSFFMGRDGPAEAAIPRLRVLTRNCTRRPLPMRSHAPSTHHQHTHTHTHIHTHTYTHTHTHTYTHTHTFKADLPSGRRASRVRFVASSFTGQVPARRTRTHARTHAHAHARTHTSTTLPHSAPRRGGMLSCPHVCERRRGGRARP